MKILKVAVGNSKEAFIEKGFSDGLNIISSDDNNKGKTIVIQSMMYALGNEPTFPTTFRYKDYCHYVEFALGEDTYCLCRYNNSFMLKHASTLMLFDNVSELKRYWAEHIFPLPKIVKQQLLRIVDPVLFFQLSFVGQDKKDTSNIAHAGYYNKADFYSMLYDICGLSGVELDENEIRKLNEQLIKIKNERYVLFKQYKILQSQDTPVSYLSSVNDKMLFGKKVQAIEKLGDTVAELRKARNKALSRKARWEATLKELRSLNRTIECGELRCMDCNSTNILFSSSQKNAYAFDVSSPDMRNEIIASINGKIESCTEEIGKLSERIGAVQEEIRSILVDESISLEAIVAYKQDIFNASDAEAKIKELDDKIGILESQLRQNAGSAQSKKESRNAILASILREMNDAYKSIDPNGNLQFDELFTKRDEVYSGSEATMFHLSRLYGLSKVLNHSCPIVVDSFRAEDLSTTKENVVLDLFKSLPNQVIFTTTLKSEEMGKYDGRDDVHHINYKDHAPSKMLSATYTEEFDGLLRQLSISMRKMNNEELNSEDSSRADT